MPSYTDKTTGTTASTIENVVYAKERMGQEANNAYTNTSTTANGYANEAKGAGSVATDTAREYVASTGQAITNSASQASAATNNFVNKASETTNTAVEQGKQDVNSTTNPSNTVGYVDQAKQLAGTALNTTRGYVEAVANKVSPADPNAPGILSTMQGTAASTLNAGAQYIGCAQASLSVTDTDRVANEINQTAASTYGTVQAKANAAKGVAQPRVDQAKTHAASATDSAKQTGSNLGQKFDRQTTADDLKSRGQDLQQNATEGVNAYLKLGQEKANEASNGY